MRIQRRASKKTVFITTIAIAVLAIGFVVYVVFASNRVPSSTENNRDGSQSNQNEPKPDDSKSQSTLTDQPAPKGTNDQTGKQQLQMTASHNMDSDTLYIRGGINNSVVYDGVCSASLTGPNQKNLNKPTTLLQNAATTDCKTIKIPLSELSVGTWKYKLTYSSATSEGSSNENTFEIK